MHLRESVWFLLASGDHGAVGASRLEGGLMRANRLWWSVIVSCGVCWAGCEDTGASELAETGELGEPVSESKLEVLEPPPASKENAVEQSSAGTGDTLCRACTSNADCGGSSALCLRRSDGVQFCGRDCRTSSCPTSYTCMRLSTTISQCVPPQLTCSLPTTDAGTAPPPDAGTPPPSGNGDAGTTTADVPNTTRCAPVASWSSSWVDFETEVLRLTNVARQTARLCGTGMYNAAPALMASPQLRCAARLHAKDMQERNYFSHTSPDGTTFSQRITAAGYTWRTVGENIAAGYPSPQAVVDGWLASAGHCQNLMSPAFTQLGIGFYGNNRWVQDFGAPL
jgi:uncharacterized protein YkwD